MRRGAPICDLMMLVCGLCVWSVVTGCVLSNSPVAWQLRPVSAPPQVLSNSPVGTEVSISFCPQYSVKGPHSKTTLQHNDYW